MGKTLLASWERPHYGVTVSALVNGVVYSTVGYGHFRYALEDALASLEARGPIEEVLAISTPDTIYRDLKVEGEGPRQLPEAGFLARVGRGDLSRVPKPRKELPPWKPPPPRKRIRVRLWRVRCRARTARAEQCKFWALPGRRLCKLHAARK